MTEPLATIRADAEDGRVVITLAGEIDLSNAADLESQLHQAVAGAAAVEMDLQPVEYLDSRGVRLLHDLSRRLAAESVPLKVVAPPDSIAGDVLRLTRLPGLEP